MIIRKSTSVRIKLSAVDMTIFLTHISLVGQLLGPRGNTLRKMEAESGAKIAIRGKGSVKEGKGRSDAAYQSNLEEDLHCLIIADTEEKVQLAIKLVNKVIQTVIIIIRCFFIEFTH